MKDVLQNVNMSRASLHRHFNAAIGRPPKAEILRVRLERAKRFLAETEIPVCEVAARTGFQNPEHFSYLFKARSGQTPGKFRAASKAAHQPLLAKVKGKAGGLPPNPRPQPSNLEPASASISASVMERGSVRSRH